jgi:hypothetical protein
MDGCMDVQIIGKFFFWIDDLSMIQLQENGFLGKNFNGNLEIKNKKYVDGCMDVQITGKIFFWINGLLDVQLVFFLETWGLHPHLSGVLETQF